MKHAASAVGRPTKGPKDMLHRRLKDNWNVVLDMGIDYNNLNRLDINSLPEQFLKDQASSSLDYLDTCLQNNVFPREDYRELLELSILYLGGTVPKFKLLNSSSSDS